jgi:hypothetical protein
MFMACRRAEFVDARVLTRGRFINCDGRCVSSQVVRKSAFVVNGLWLASNPAMLQDWYLCLAYCSNDRQVVSQNGSHPYDD